MNLPDDPHYRPREEQHLIEIARTTPSAREIAAKTTGTSEETAALFDSDYRPHSEHGEGMNRPA